MVANTDEAAALKLKDRVAVVSQTTKKEDDFLKVVDFLVRHCREVRVFNTICNATFENQQAADELSKEVDVMLIVGGKNSSNTKQLLEISRKNCPDSHLIENSDDIEPRWFLGKTACGITAGASTPDWIIQDVILRVRKLEI